MLLPLLVFGPMAMAFAAWLAGRYSKKVRDILVCVTGVVTFLLTLLLWKEGTSFALEGFCGLGIHLKADGFRSLYASVAGLMWAVSGLFSPEYFAHHHNRNRYYFFNLITLGATLGVFLSDDLYTTLIFFEIMSFSSFPWVAQEETPGAIRAAETYLAVAVIGGLATLMGLFLLWHELGTLSFDGMKAAIAARPSGQDGLITAASWLTLAGFAAKAGMFPLHIWLPKAHPVAPAPASALLSGILTKSGIFGVLVIAGRLMNGNTGFANVLLVFACVTMFLGAVLALFAVDLKRVLACSSMSQIGFITVGISFMILLGEEGATAAYGAVLHMVNHSLIKLCLFLCAGVVFMNTEQLNLNQIRGFGRKKPLLHFCFLSGALALACIPPVGSGYNSKSLLHEGILEYISLLQESGAPWGIYRFVEILFLLSGGLTVAYMAKLYICLFVEKNTEKRQAEFDALKHYISPISAAGLVLVSVLLPVMGILGDTVMSPLAARSMSFLGLEPVGCGISYFSGENLLGALESIAIGAAVYLIIFRPLMTKKDHSARIYPDLWPEKLDLENLVCRPLLLRVLPGFFGAITFCIASLPEMIILLFRRTMFTRLKARQDVPAGNRFTWNLGRLLNSLAAFLNRNFLRRKPMRTDFEYSLAESWQNSRSVLLRIGASISFGLLLLVAGLCATFIYLLTR